MRWARFASASSETLDDHDASTQQRLVGRGRLRTEGLDAQVVDADDLDPALDEVSGASGDKET